MLIQPVPIHEFQQFLNQKIVLNGDSRFFFILFKNLNFFCFQFVFDPEHFFYSSSLNWRFYKFILLSTKYDVVEISSAFRLIEHNLSNTIILLNSI